MNTKIQTFRADGDSNCAGALRSVSSRSSFSKLKVRAGANSQRVPPGQYRVRIINIEQKATFNKPIFIFKFEIAEGDHHGKSLNGFVNGAYEVFSPNTKLYQWYQVASGEAPEAGEAIEFGAFENKIFLVEVKDKESKKTKLVFSNVVELLGVICEL
jgi:hypothetical protein